MPTTARFNIKRLQILDELFQKEKLVKLWRNLIRQQLRKMDVLDLYDYYDFTLNINDKVQNIRDEILAGRYKAHKPLIYKIEKKYGISRHLMIPNPSDALVFQVIANYLGENLSKIEPTKQAYFSRDRATLKLPHEYKDYPVEFWLELWKKYQEEIFKFSENHKYLVVTDITNYFDNIGLRELRNVIASRFSISEVVLDLLFRLVEELSWAPDYLPYTLKGLPTINIEAPRLLAHILLFEVDEILSEKTSNSFVRWMDDINFGVDSKEKGYEILSDLNDVLKSRGLALNLSKTNIYTAKQAERHFLFKENRKLNKLEEKINSGRYIKSKLAFKIEIEFKKHLKNQNYLNWGKVTKRYYTLAGKLKTTRLLKYSYDLFIEKPGLRPNIILYLQRLNYSKLLAKNVLNILKNIKRYDDVFLFQLVKLLTQWKIPVTKESILFINEIETILLNFKSGFDFYCYLWFAAKYSEPKKLYTVLLRNKKIWYRESFLRRQVLAVLPKIYSEKKKHIKIMINELTNKGPDDVTSVGVTLIKLLEIEKYPKGMNFYLFPQQKHEIYPLAKFLHLLTILNSDKFSDKSISIKIKHHINDDWYLFWLNKFFPALFQA